MNGGEPRHEPFDLVGEVGTAPNRGVTRPSSVAELAQRDAIDGGGERRLVARGAVRIEMGNSTPSTSAGEHPGRTADPDGDAHARVLADEAGSELGRRVREDMREDNGALLYFPLPLGRRLVRSFP